MSSVFRELIAARSSPPQLGAIGCRALSQCCGAADRIAENAWVIDDTKILASANVTPTMIRGD